MTFTIDEGFEIMDAEKRTGKIVQIGSQWPSSPLTLMSKKWIEEGRLGQITLVKSWENRNTPAGAWFYPIPICLGLLGLVGLALHVDVHTQLGGDAAAVGPYLISHLGLPPGSLSSMSS